MSPASQKAISLAVGAVWLALLVVMITVEGEFGALPLALVLAGTVGYATARLRQR